MKVAIYKKDGIYTTVLNDIKNPKLVDDKLFFENGGIFGFDENHILLNDEEEIPQTIEAARLLDKRENFVQVTIE
jgi:hypothetical protein